MRKKALIFSLIGVVCLLGLMFTFSFIPVFKSGNRNLPVYSVDRQDNKIALTFNCAWGDEDIDVILSELEKYKVKATFFVVGEWAEKYPQRVTDIIRHGHEIGGHSYNHKDYTQLNNTDLAHDIEKNQNAIGKSIKYIRVPSGAYNNRVIDTIEAEGYIAVQWSIDTIDYGNTDCDTIYRRATEKTESGDIILMHTGTQNTSVALGRILEYFKGKFECVSVSELLYTDNYVVDSAGEMIAK